MGHPDLLARLSKAWLRFSTRESTRESTHESRPAAQPEIRRAVLEDVEARLLYSADIAPMLAEPNLPAQVQLIDTKAETNSAAETNQTLVQQVSAPLAFEQNLGQAAEGVDFLARGNGYTTYLADGNALIALQSGDNTHQVGLNIVGGQEHTGVSGESALGSYSNYFVGDSSQWLTGVSHYGAVRYNDVYDGVDIRYYGNQRSLEYDFIVAAGSDYQQISLSFTGVLSKHIAENGDLVLLLDNEGRNISFKAPVSYQMIDGVRVDVASRYLLHADGSVGFAVDNYDRSVELVIDPTLQYGSYLGGTGTESINGITTDASGNMFVTGVTTSSDLTVSGYDTALGGSQDAFFARYNSDGSLGFISYWGGDSDTDAGQGIALDGSGNIYIVGLTRSSTMTVLNGADSTFTNSQDGFLAKFNAAGNTLLYSTFGIDGGGGDIYRGIAVSGSEAYVTGGFGTTNNRDVLIARYDTSISGAGSLIAQAPAYSVSGGAAADGYAITLDGSGRVYVAGQAQNSFTNSPPSNVGDSTHGGNLDGFVMRLTGNLSGWDYLSYIGGSGDDAATSIALNSSNQVIVGGYTASSGLASVGAFDTTLGTSTVDGFIAKFDATTTGGASQLVTSYFGTGNAAAAVTRILGVAVDSSDNIIIVGDTNTSIPLSGNALDTSLSSTDAFVAKLNAGATSVSYSSYFGGSGDDTANAVNVRNDLVYFAGTTNSTSAISTPGAADGSLGGASDGFIARLSLAEPPVVTAGGTLAYTENGAATAVSSTLTVTDSDSTNLTGATIQITGNYQNGQDVLAFVDQLGITGSWNAGTGTLTLSGTTTVANYQTALRAVTYVNTSDNPSTLTRTVTFTADDGSNTGNATRSITVAPANDAPVVTSGGTLAYTENDAATAIDTGLTVSDVDSTNLTGATIQITGNYQNGQDVLAFVDQLGITGSWNAGTGTLTLSGTTTVANYQTALRAVTYVNTSDNPSTLTRTVTFTADDGSNTGNATRSITVAPANDAPVVTSGGTLAYTENDAATAIDTGLTVSDVDSTNLTGATIQITGNYQNGQDVLAFVDQLGITGSWNAGTGTLTLSGTTTVANYQTALRAVTYVNTSDNPSTLTRTVTFTADDGSNTGNATRSITVAAANDAPVVTAGGTLAYTENDAATAVSSTLTLTDVDSANLTGATIQITGNYQNGQDVLAFVDQLGITGSWNAGTGALTLSGTTTVANYQTALRAVTYVNTSDNPSTLTRTVTFTADDGSNTGNATRSITVAPANDAPVVTSGGTLAYTENDAATAIDTGLTVSDVDSTNLTGATIQITGNYQNGQDVLAFVDQLGITGSWNAGTGTLTLSGTTTVANYQTALRAVTYVNTSDNPSTLTRTVTFTADDGSNTGNATRSITVAAANDAPVVTAGGTLAYTENDAATAVSSTLTVTDADSTNLTGATIQITGNYQNGQDVLAFVDQLGITGSWNAGTGTLTLSGTTTVANYQTALRAVTYVNTSDNPSTLTRTVTFTANDGVATGNATRSITVAAVNDAPVVTSGGTLAYTENDAATAIDTGLTVSDVDSTNLTGATIQITGNYQNGQDVLAFVDQLGITGSWNAGTGTLTLSGTTTVANYQTALRAVTYVNSSNSPSTLTRTVTFTANDGSNTGNATRSITVAAVNDAPVITNAFAFTAITEDQTNNAGQLVSTIFASTDADAGAVNGIAIFSQGASTGTWQYSLDSGTSWNNFGTVSGSAALLVRSNDLLRFVPNGLNATTASVTFLAWDQTSGTAGSKVDIANRGGIFSLSAGNRSSTISVTAVNDAPTLTGTNNFTAINEDDTSSAGTLVSALISGNLADVDTGAVSGIAVSAVDNTNGIWQYTTNGGGSWTAFGTPSGAAARLLAADASTSIRFVPNANWNGTATITYRAWDQTSGAAGGTGDTSTNGGTSAFSLATASPTITVNAVNDAPVVTSGGTLAYTENDAATAIDSGLTVSDIDSTNLTGATIQITGNYQNGQDVLAFVDQLGITGSWNAGTGTLTLSGTTTVANYQTALRAVTYVNTSDNPSTLSRTVTFTANDGLATGNATRDITVAAVNDAPVITAGGTLAYTENDAATLVSSTLTVTDVDSTNLTGATIQITGNYQNGQDVLAFVDQLGITGSWNAATGTLTLTGTTTVANYQTALRAVTYVNTSDNPSTLTRTVTFTADDGSNTGNATRSITVAPANDAPVVTSGGTLAYTENDAATAIDTGLTVSDVDSTNLTGATIQITGNYQNGQDVLAFVDQLGIIGSWNAGTGTLTLSGTTTVANYQTALRAVTYVNTSDNPSTLTRTVTFTADDGSNTGNATRSITVAAANDAPVVTAGGTLAYTENDAATVVSSTLTVTDVDSTNLTGATIQITGNYQNGQDVLAFVDQLGITGSWNAATGTLTLTGTTTVTNYQTALRAVTYVNTSDNPSTLTRTVTFTADDGSNTGNATRSITVAAVSDAPVVTSGGTLAYTENDAATAIDTGLTVSDIDSANLTGATIQITGNYQNGQDVLAFVDQLGITGSWNAATGTLTLSGTTTVANYQTALRAVTYVNSIANPSALTRTVTFTANDGAASGSATRSISVTTLNNAPVVTSGGTMVYIENDLATAIDTGLTVTDSDNANLTGATIQITGNYVNGEDVLAFTNQLGITGSWNAGIGTLTLSGTTTVANYQTALRAVTYVNTSDTPSTLSRTVTFTANDGLTTGSATSSITVAAVNDAPVVTSGGSLAYTENDAATAIDTGLTVSDIDSANLTGATIQITGNYQNAQDVLAFVDQLGITGSWNAATGTLTLTGTTTVANYQTALRAVTYVNTSDNPSTLTRTVTFTADDGSNTGNATRSITVAAANDAPVVAAGGTLAYTENDVATAVSSTLTVTDADSTNLTGATIQITGNYQNGQDVLAFVDQLGITGSWNAGTGTLTLSDTTTVANYQTALRAVTYVNTSDNPSTLTRTVTFTANDGVTTGSATRNITVAAVNDAPVVTAGGTLAYTENDAATAVSSTLTVTDADSTNLTGATIQITGNYQNGQDVLAFVDQLGITGSWNAGTGTLTLSGTTTVANYQTALRAVTYVNTSDNPSTLTRTVTFTANDGVATGNATRSITVAAVNDAPVVTSGGTLAYTENDAATAIDTGLTVSDVDSTNLTGATIQITGNYQNGQDVLAFVDQLGITGSWNAGTGTLTLSGTTTVANYQTALRAVTYVNTSDNPSTLTRTVTFTANDGVTTGSATRNITVAAVNDAPVVTAGGTLAYTENDAATAVSSTLTVTDADSTNLTGATIQITGNYQNGQDVLAFVDQLGITGSWNAGTGTLTLSGTTTVANYQTALRAVTYVNTSDNPSTLTRTVTFTANDGVATGNATRSITVAAVNDAPVVTSGGTLAYTENDAATAIDTGLTVSDIDSTNLTSATIQITGNYQNGQDVLAFVDQLGITGSWNAGTGTLTLSGTTTVANYQTALRAVTYVNSSNSPSTLTRTVTFTANDGSNTGNATRSITVAAVNDAPVITNAFAFTAITEDQTNNAGQLVSTIFASTDADAGAVNGIAIFSQGASTGTWQYSLDSGTSWNNFGTVSGSAALLVRSNDLLRFVPNGLNATTASVTFLAWDQTSGTAGSKVDIANRGGIFSLSAGNRSSTISVTAVNDAPTLTGTNNFTAINEDDTSSAGTLVSALISGNLADVDTGAVSGIAVSAVDNTNGIWQYTTNGGGSWTAFGTPSGAAARLLAADASTSIRFVPNANWNGTATITYRAWDQTSGAAGGTGDTSTNGGTSAFSLATASPTITVNAVNDAPTLDTNTGASLAEGGSITLTTAMLSASDLDNTNAQIIYTLSAAPANGQLTVSGVPVLAGGSFTQAELLANLVSFTHDGSETSTDSFSFVLSDTSGGVTGSFSFALSITPVNDNAPIITSNGGGATAGLSVTENVALLGTVTASDADLPAQTLTYSIAGGADAALFGIDSSTGVLRFLSAPDYETPADANADNIYQVIVAVSDGSLTDTQSLSISVADVNEFALGPISDTDAAANIISEAAANGSAVGSTANAVDADGSQNAVSYALADDAGGRFAIDAVSGVVTLANASLLDYETSTSHNITVIATSADGSTSSQVFTINLADANEFPVGAISDSNTSVNAVPENAANGSSVGITAFASDADAANNAVSYSLDDTAGGRFAIDANSGVVSVANAALLDYETTTVHQITVRATSADGSFSTQSFSINLLPINDNSPVITSDGGGAAATVTMAENAGAVTNVQASDADLPAQTIQFAIVGGSDAAAFSLDANSGALQFRSAPDYENPTDSNLDNVYQVIVQANDGAGLSTVQTINVSVINANEAPAVSVPNDGLVKSGSAVPVLGISVSDADNNINQVVLSVDQGSLSLTPVAGVTVTANAGQSVLSLQGTQAALNASLASLSYQSKNDFVGMVRISMVASDSGGLTQSANVRIVVDQDDSQLPEQPVATPNPSITPTPSPELEKTDGAEGSGGDGGDNITPSNNGARGDQTGQDVFIPPPVVNEMPWHTTADLSANNITANVELEGNTSPDINQLTRIILNKFNIDPGETSTRPGSTSDLVVDWGTVTAPRKEDDLFLNISPTQAGKVATVAMTAGVVWWAGRSVGLITALMASVPAWRTIDPLPILARDRKRKGEDEPEGLEDLPPPKDPASTDLVLEARQDTHRTLMMDLDA